MKVLLVSPPTESTIRRAIGITGPPFGLAHLALMVKDEHDVKIIDSIAEGFEKEGSNRR